MHGSGGSSGSRQRWDGGWRDNWEENRRKQGTPSHAAADARSKKLLEKAYKVEAKLLGQQLTEERERFQTAEAGAGVIRYMRRFCAE